MALVSWVMDFCIAICLQGEKGRKEGGREEGREGLYLQVEERVVDSY